MLTKYIYFPISFRITVRIVCNHTPYDAIFCPKIANVIMLIPCSLGHTGSVFVYM